MNKQRFNSLNKSICRMISLSFVFVSILSCQGSRTPSIEASSQSNEVVINAASTPTEAASTPTEAASSTWMATNVTSTINATFPREETTGEANNYVTKESKISATTESSSAFIGALLIGENMERDTVLVALSSQGDFLWQIPVSYKGYNGTLDISGCSYYGGFYDNGYASISNYDLMGREVSSKSLELEHENERPFGVFPSATGRWLAYMLGSGEQGRGPSDAQFVDVGIIDFDNGSGKNQYSLTKYGGAPAQGFDWSPDGRFLAYSDYDKDGIIQLTIYGVLENVSYQLTDFGEEMRNWIIREVAWASEGDKIAFAAIRSGIMQDGAHNEEGIVGVSSLSNQGLVWQANVPHQGEYMLTWEPNGHRLLVIINRPAGGSMAWFDGNNGNQLRIIPVKPGVPVPLEGFDKIAVIGYESFLYNTVTGSIHELGNQLEFSHVNSVMIPAYGPVDKSSCEQ